MPKGVSSAARRTGDAGTAGSTDGRSLIRFDHVSKSFPGADALKDVTVEIPKGRVVGLLGPNGSGKSTFLKLIAGLHRPTRGEVFVAGEPPGRRTKELVAYLPEVDHIYPWMTVECSLNFLSAFYKDWDGAKAERLLDFFKLPRRHKVGKLSKGMRGKLRLTAVLARSAPVVLLDEPLSGIDPPSRVSIVDALVREFDAGEQTIIISTHEVLETESFFDSLIFLHQGRIALQGDVDTLRQRYGASVQDLFKEVIQ